MGGIYQLLDILAVAIPTLVVLLLLAILVGKLFQSRRTRKRILWGTIIIYALAFIVYFGYIGFLLSGNVN